MPEIGKSLVFYLTYFSEMQKLYEEKGSLPGFDKTEDADAHFKKIEIVGKQAGVEAVELLLSCISDLRRRLEESGVAVIKPCRRETMERKWQVIYDLLPARGKKPDGQTHQIGLYLDPDGVIPWIWSRGGRAAEDRIQKLLPGVQCLGSKQMGWSSGSIALKSTPIAWKSAVDFSIEAEPIVAETTNVLKAISPKFVERFISRD